MRPIPGTSLDSRIPSRGTTQPPGGRVAFLPRRRVGGTPPVVPGPSITQTRAKELGAPHRLAEHCKINLSWVRSPVEL